MMKLRLSALFALGMLAACGDDATPAQEQQAEQLEERADMIEEAGDERAEMIDERTDARADALNDRADALEDGDVPVGSSPVGATGTQGGMMNDAPAANTGTPPANAAGAGENG